MTDCYIGSALAGLTLMAGWFLGTLLSWLISWVLEKRDQRRARKQGQDEELLTVEDEQFGWFTTPPGK
jgi:hypothetical protein